MAEITVKQYKRKDGTVVRGSTRKLTKAEKQARKQSLGNHLKKGAKLGAKILGGLGAVQGAAYGGAVGGPVGALVGGAAGGATNALVGASSGAFYGGATYGVKRAMAKRRDPKGFKKSFDYSRNTEDVKMFIGQQDESSINFARPKGAKDKMPRKKSGLRTAAKVGAGLAGAAAIGAGLKNRKAIGGALRNAGGAVRDTAMVGEMKARQMGRKGMSAASSAVGSARQKVGGKLDSVAGKMEKRAGDELAKINSKRVPGENLGKITKPEIKQFDKLERAGSLRDIAKKIRGN
jgi:outer membrane lipoprotein SlyB